MGSIIITGVPGVGKSTVLSAAAEATKRPVVVYGTVMFEVASARRLAKHRDEMRRLSPSLQKEIQKEAAEKIAAMGDTIVDTHCTIRTPKGYLPGIPEWVAKGLSLETIVLVEATPREILGRRAKDATRARDVEPEEGIAAHQGANRAAAMAIATLTGATVAIVENHDGKVEEAKRQLLSALG
ncbi:MAG: adenylate kinase [Methanobacteriota archaeon]